MTNPAPAATPQAPSAEAVVTPTAPVAAAPVVPAAEPVKPAEPVDELTEAKNQIKELTEKLETQKYFSRKLENEKKDLLTSINKKEVIQQFDLPDGADEFLTGKNKEELTAQAEKFKTLFTAAPNTGNKPKPNALQGLTQTPANVNSDGEAARAAILAAFNNTPKLN